MPWKRRAYSSGSSKKESIHQGCIYATAIKDLINKTFNAPYSNNDGYS